MERRILDKQEIQNPLSLKFNQILLQILSKELSSKVYLFRLNYKMKLQILLSVLVLILFPCVQASLGVDVSQLFSESTYHCIKSGGHSFVIIRGFCSYGAPDHNAVQGLKNAKAAGLNTDIYMFPCRGKSAKTQVDEMFSAIDKSLYGTVWIDVETNPSTGCSWSGHDAASNCQFVTDLVNEIKAKGKSAGIYASKYMWQSIFGSATACHAVASQPLWYAHYDGSASFSDFSAFGGWTKPHMKQYQGDTTLCGAGVDKNFA